MLVVDCVLVRSKDWLLRAVQLDNCSSIGLAVEGSARLDHDNVVILLPVCSSEESFARGPAKLVFNCGKELTSIT